jgi:hypothetical protein
MLQIGSQLFDVPDTTTARNTMRTDKNQTPQTKQNDKARDLPKGENVELNVEELEERIAPRKIGL